MVGATLSDLRERIAEHHDDGGRYYVNCARTGERPVPVAGKRFPDRETAVAAAELAAEYRAELRRYDPRLPHYDLVVSEDPGDRDSVDPVPSAEDSLDAATASDFCHDVAAAVFEALSELGENSVERAVLEAYLHSAESVTDPDELCLVLLSTAATEIDARLDPGRQARVLRTAANRLGTPSRLDDPMRATLARLDGLSLVGDYAVVPNGDTAADSDSEGDTGRSWRITVEEYAFEASEGRVPTLPFAVELFRHLPAETVAVADLRAMTESRWECVVSTDPDRARAVSLAVPENR
ncbi:DUF7551 domain-containing protein [Halorussus aquaticus]|uniref:Uncharacterized protein n=1 Tax=Halorussus aquaticus TaxID=2953748 RepID=A0ABD5PWP1_9EURY|nr:hypothetical protein [Halorussus aquaticus]